MHNYYIKWNTIGFKRQYNEHMKHMVENTMQNIQAGRDMEYGQVYLDVAQPLYGHISPKSVSSPKTCKRKWIPAITTEKKIIRATASLTQHVQSSAKKSNLCPKCYCQHQPHVNNATLTKTCLIQHPVNFVENGKESSIACPAASTLPNCLSLKQIGESNLIITNVFINAFTRFGPLKGEQIEEKDLISDQLDFQHIWFLKHHNCGIERKFISTANKKASNWCHYLQFSESLETANWIAVAEKNSIHFVANSDMPAGETVLVGVPFFGSVRRLWADSSVTYCKKCATEFSSALLYQRHWHLVHPAGLSSVKSMCNLCSRLFLSTQALDEHVKSSHGELNFVCHVCNACLLSRVRLRNHIRLCHPDQSEALRCDQCNVVCKSKQALRHHNYNVHSSALFSCTVCGLNFKQKSLLQRHSQIHKPNYKKWQCQVCQSNFSNATNLKVHMLKHSKVKPFHCAFCTVKYTSKSMLIKHYTKIHRMIGNDMPPIERCVPFTFECYSSSTDEMTAPLLMQKSEELNFSTDSQDVIDVLSHEVLVKTEELPSQ